jgi:hypothetical protein
MAASPAIPPTTPPAIAPVLDDPELEIGELDGVAEVDDVEL